ncbi:GbsR/MarR family transcriptional regulator [Streptomyces sp. TS71-3]|uniref:GbsR/MarR family transcriptional regulator n=1 Tax=Streptomyces sp. TS71-3 TaxID=2733862 RepID=UPI001B2755B9|nr:MarR family transcriptional regulator [Streptomyces sp. TS71-3]GHJ40028.1 MarR family transcriptional regulator [Streptomyces sp. TS71-3]
MTETNGTADGSVTENGAGRPPADPEGVSRFVEGFASQLVSAGMLRMPARVFAALLASEDGVLTSGELGKQLQVSPAAVSGAIRYLDGVTMVTREREPGSRRERYRISRDQWYEILTDREVMLRRWEQTLREGIATMGADSKPGRRIAETLEFFSFVHTEFSAVMDRWRKHRDEMFGED